MPRPITEGDITPKKAADLLAESERIFEAYKERAASDFLCFVRGLTIAAAVGPRVFESVMAPFQRDTFEDMAPSIHALRDGDQPEWSRWWLERTKKASKDADLAIILLWVLCFPTRPFYSQVGAGDKDQAAIVKERITHLLHHNPWLNEYVEVVQWHVRSKKALVNGQPMARLDIMATDIGGAHGGTPDLLVINELTHVTKWEFVQNLMDNADGVPRGMAIVATNAGYKGTQAEVWRKNAIGNRRWRVHIWSKPAPWHNMEAIEDARTREVSKSRFNRLWYGKWPSGKGDALDDELVNKCFVSSWKKSLDKPLPGYIYVAGLDIGVHKDHTGLVVVGVNQARKKIDLAWMQAWEPSTKGRVPLGDVRSACILVNRIFRLEALLYDPSQAELLAQDLRPYMQTIRMPFTPKNCDLMATRLIQVINNGFLRLFDDDSGRLRRDLGKFDIVEKPYGIKMQAVSDEFGHADVGTALLICLPAAVELLEGVGRLMEGDVLVDTNDEDLTEEEVERMPESLRDIYDMGEEDELESFYKRRPDPIEDVL